MKNHSWTTLKYEPVCSDWPRGEISVRISRTENGLRAKVVNFSQQPAGEFFQELVTGMVLQRRVQQLSDIIGAECDLGMSERHWALLANSEEIGQAKETASHR